jgi:radical SAM superfamily enzyme YgiQ (UPF0313 family)
MKSRPFVFITLKEYDNLGIGYMISLLKERGYVTKVIDINKNKTTIHRILKNLDPQLVGFSVVYQYYITRFIELVDYLRSKGINCHFTAGGHYASLKYEELFEYIPYLDSIVMFEGENTILELAGCIQNGEDWREIKGITYKDKGKIVKNTPRPFERDLDRFPFPFRSPLRTYAFELKFATIIAARGCVNDCSFCNTKKFYSQAEGFVKRIRRPEMVVKEMKMLNSKYNCSVFLFMDDDFPMKTSHGHEWILKFCNELERAGLKGKILWKINCRPDEVDEDRFKLMKKHGLFLVFLGMEDGTDAGLKRFNKKMTVEKTLKAVNILKKNKIGFNYGFMPFHPYTTYKSLNENLDFLKLICCDGYTPVTFLKMMPYYETRIEKELIKEGRLKVSIGKRDYDFLDNSLNHYYDFITDCFGEWLRATHGLENIANWARNYSLVYLHYLDVTPDGMKLYRKIRRTISESNLYLLDSMKELALIFESDQYKKNNQLLESYRGNIKIKHNYFKKTITETTAKLLSLVEYQQIKAYVEKFVPEEY